MIDSGNSAHRYLTTGSEKDFRDSTIERYSAVLNMVLEGLPLREILHSLVLSIEAQKLGTKASVLLLSDDGQRLLTGAAPSLPSDYNDAIHGVEIGPEVGSCGAAAYLCRRVIVEDIETHPNWQPYKALPLKAGLKACWSEPICDSKGEVIGTFAMYYDTIKSPTDLDLLLIQEAAKLASLAIERSRAMYVERLSSKIFDHLPVALLITNEDGSVLNFNPVFNQLVNDGEPCSGEFDMRAFLRPSASDVREQLFEHLARGHAWQGELLGVNKAGQQLELDLTVAVIRDSFTQTNCFAWLISDISARKQADQLIQYQKFHDPLTGLVNRNGLIDNIDKLISAHQQYSDVSFSLLMMDVDHFKQINDTLGHDNGDRLLQKIASRIGRYIPTNAVLSRVGADEFALLLPNEQDQDKLTTLAANLNQALTNPIIISDQTLLMSVSIGIARFPQDADNLDFVLKYASQAMFSAKRQGRNGYCFFNQSLQQQATRTAYLTQHLKNAISNNEFELYVQPMVSPLSGKIIKAEVLLRWRHDGQFISPDEFIPIAEQTNLIVPIGEWVRSTALNYAVELHKLDFAVPLSINVSPLEFWSSELQQRFIDFFDAKLEDINMLAQFSPLITLEITESLMMKQQNDIHGLLKSLQDKGLKIAIDDFGTGYSSLAYLVNFPADQIKIDKSFIQKLSDDDKHQALVTAIINLSLSLGLQVVVEGIETRTELDFINQFDVMAAQGYYFYKPMAFTEFTELLKKQ
ncbi:EAL domain-containing protein [Shewanella sp. WXL01]|uniref:bifunctional diguanylate cyclase/phosphodiesterase n=1 Tax=Shewanella sp. WXL01 TaxID=2709721 RepID=UPI0014385D7C|nr:EAL domain-containing protein [Shewanella sp. WXL01]NKF50588.1 EAL domain-containing protein [Shewanella sp. WXL01]